LLGRIEERVLVVRVRHASLILAAVGTCLTIGCAEETPELSATAIVTPAVVQPRAAEPAAAPANPATVPVATITPPEVKAVAHTEANAKGNPEGPLKDADSASGAYKPPFPDRVDLFVAPKRQGGGPAQANGDNAVELMGFVRVDRQRAVLSINGEITPLAEGESQFGIEVISVRPPMVVLQRGRQRWQATLE
jgi:hypothetical protein